MPRNIFDLSRRENRDPLRLALQSAVAGGLMFTVMKFLELPEEFVGVLSAVMVIQPSSGAALGEAKNRFVATIIGALIGVLCLAVLPSGYGTVAAIAVSMFVMNYLAGFKEQWRYGVVAAVALSLGSDSDVIQTALDRSIAIGLGVVIGALVTLIVWPQTAEKRTRVYLSDAFRTCGDYLAGSIDRAMGQGGDMKELRRKYLSNIAGARDAYETISMGHGKQLKARIDATHTLWNGAVFLRRIGDESNPAANDDLKGYVSDIKEEAYKAAHMLADGERLNDARIEAMEHSLSQARQAAGASFEGSDAFEAIARGALVFSLGEVVDSLKDYNAALQD